MSALRGLSGLLAIVAIAIAIPLLVGFWGVQREAAWLHSLVDIREAELDSLRSTVHVLETRADSLAKLSRARADTVKVSVEHWRTLTDTLRLKDTVWVRELAEAGDTMAAACMELGRECSRALEANDEALRAQQRQAYLLASYNAELAGRLRREARQKWIYGLGGVGITLALCRAAR